MGNKLHVSNLPWSMTEEALSEVFSKCGTVTSSKIITERDTGRSKGFGFVEMSSDAEASKAITDLNGLDVEGRPLRVQEARPQEERPRGGFSGDRGGYGGGGGGRGGDRGGYGGGRR